MVQYFKLIVILSHNPSYIKFKKKEILLIKLFMHWVNVKVLSLLFRTKDGIIAARDLKASDP